MPGNQNQIRNRKVKFFTRLLMQSVVFVLVAFWVFSGGGQIGNFNFPPKVEKAHAAAGYSAKGTAQSKTSGTTLTKTLVAIASGATIIVTIAADTGDTISTVTFGATSLSNANTIYSIGNVNTFIYYAYIASGSTQTVTVTFASAITAKAMTIMEVTGLVSDQSRDQLQSSFGTGTTPSSGATSQTTADQEFIVGAVGTEGPNGDTAGTWSNSFNAGQRLGTTGAGGTSSGNTSADSNGLTTQHYRLSRYRGGGGGGLGLLNGGGNSVTGGSREGVDPSEGGDGGGQEHGGGSQGGTPPSP